MKGFNSFIINVEELVSRYEKLKKENKTLTDELDRIKKDLDYLHSKGNDLPELNRKLKKEREIVNAKVKKVLKKLEEAKI